ncbi:MAG: pilin [Pedobacter sp.]|jgi:hypothetical protein
MPKKIIFVGLVLIFVFVNIFFIFNFSLAQFGLENFGSGSNNTFFSTNRSVPETVTRIISIIIGIVGVLLLCLLIYGGILYATSAGGDQIETAKKVLTYAIVGLIIVALSFVITNYVLVGLFADEDEWQTYTGSGSGSNGSGGSNGTGSSQTLPEELLGEGGALVQEGEDMVSRGEELRERGEQLVEEGNEGAGQILIDDGEELINGGNAKIEEGNMLLNEEQSLRGSNEGDSRNTREPADTDVDCQQSGDRCGIFRNFCCSYLECDGAAADSGWPRFAGECASGNPECKEVGERCITLGQDCCSGLNCLEGYCAN